MISQNNLNIPQEKPEKCKIRKEYEENEVITSKQKISNSDSSEIIKINSKENISKEEQDIYKDLIFGVSINNKYPRKLGAMYAFCYIKNFPIFTIGPDCKYIRFILKRPI